MGIYLSFALKILVYNLSSSLVGPLFLMDNQDPSRISAEVREAVPIYLYLYLMMCARPHTV